MDPCFEEVETSLSIDLHPSRLRCIAESVREELDALLLAYSPELSGVVLAYRDQQILTRGPMVHSFFPYFHVDAVAKLCVFRIQQEQHLGAPPPVPAALQFGLHTSCCAAHTGSLSSQALLQHMPVARAHRSAAAIGTCTHSSSAHGPTAVSIGCTVYADSTHAFAAL